MKIPDIPKNEKQRLNALRSLDILDTLPSERFDRITRLAKRVFNVPIAVVSLIDENRQWFKSCMGLEVTETPRDISFCGHAILQNDIFMIPDAQQDDRFHDNPLVTGEPKIRFYAGCPIKEHNGYTLGTLCMIDRNPRKLDDTDLEMFKDLSKMVERELSIVDMLTQDELTNIMNRRGFMAAAEQNLQLCIRHELKMSLVFFDLDEFKSINDNFGHSEGDSALIKFSDLLTQSSRSSDIVARLSGDEFVALLINASEQFAYTFVKRLEQSASEVNKNSHDEYDILFSYGIVEFTQHHHKSINELLHQGDTLMYELKKKKKNGLVN